GRTGVRTEGRSEGLQPRGPGNPGIVRGHGAAPRGRAVSSPPRSDPLPTHRSRIPIMKLIISLFLAAGWLASIEWLAAKAVAADEKQPDKEPVLPLSQVVLYTSGVGYFQRDGGVEENAQVELRFKTEDINDLLKSLVVQDYSGGQVSTVTYGSRDP